MIDVNPYTFCLGTEKNKVIKKQKQALETEKENLLSLLEKQRKELQQLKKEKQELVCQLEQERKAVQGNS